MPVDFMMGFEYEENEMDLWQLVTPLVVQGFIEGMNTARDMDDADAMDVFLAGLSAGGVEFIGGGVHHYPYKERSGWQEALEKRNKKIEEGKAKKASATNDDEVRSLLGL
jgi:ABC-type glycerol-3-phosphate transport system substrate-binding protein